MIQLARNTFKYLGKNDQRLRQSLATIKHKSLSNNYLCFNLFRNFSTQNQQDSIPLNQTINFFDSKSELYIENQETRQINDLVAKGRFNEAVDKCLEILSQQNKVDENRIRYLLAFSLKSAGRQQEAIDAFKSFIKNVETSGNQSNERDNLEIFVEVSYFELAQLCLERGDMSQCIEFTEKTISMNPTHINQKLVESFIFGKQIERGIQFLKKQHERVPQNEPILYLLGFLQEGNGDIEGAIQSYQKVIDLSDNQKHPEANLRVGMILKRKGDYETSTCYLMRTVESEPKNFQARFNLGQNFRYLGEGMLGKENLEACLEIEPNNPLPYYDLALCCEQIGEIEKCISYLQKNVEANDTHFESFLRLANIFAAQNERQQALNYIKKGINSDNFFRENIHCINLLQTLLEKANDNSQGNSEKIRVSNSEDSSSYSKIKVEKQYKLMEEQFMNQIKQKNNMKCEMFNFFTQLFLLTDEKDLAIQSEKKLVEFNSNVLQHRVNLATLYRSKLQLVEAINEYKELIKLQPEEGNYHYFCGQIHLQAGMIKEAIISYNKTINIQGESDYALFELYSCYKLNNQIEEANQCKNTLLQYFPDFFSEEIQHINYIEQMCIQNKNK